MSKYPGFVPPADAVGPQLIPRVAAVDLSQTQMLQDQIGMTRDPARQRELMLIAALEARFAKKAAAAQQGVQDAALSTNPLRRGDIIYSSPWQAVAKGNRGMLRDQAAQEYNAGLPAGYMGPRKAIGNPFYGA